MSEIIIGQSQQCCGRRRVHPQLLSRLGLLGNPYRLAFDYFMEDFGTSLHQHPINKECILVNPKVAGLQTDYPNLKWNVTQGHFMFHQSKEIQEGLCGLDDTNYASFETGHADGTILIDAWFGGIGSWVSVTLRQLEAKYVVVENGDYEWEKKVQFRLYHNGELLWEASEVKDTNILNSFPLGMTIIGMNCRISSTDGIKEVKNFIFEKSNPVTIGSSFGYMGGEFTGISAMYFFGGHYGPSVKL